MALLNRSLTPEEVKKLLDMIPLPEKPSIFDLIRGERHQYVRYDAALDRIVYERVDTFYFSNDETASDSRWMVPKAP